MCTPKVLFTHFSIYHDRTLDSLKMLKRKEQKSVM